MHRKQLEAIALELKRQKPCSLEVYQETNSNWQRGTFDEWSTIVLGIAKVCENLMGNDANGNRLFKRDKFLAACNFDRDN